MDKEIDRLLAEVTAINNTVLLMNKLANKAQLEHRPGEASALRTALMVLLNHNEKTLEYAKVLAYGMKPENA